MEPIKVMMVPDIGMIGTGVSGIHTVVRAYYRTLPKYGIELVPWQSKHDVSVAHAGMMAAFADVAMLHGLYFTADYNAPKHEWRANRHVIDSVRGSLYTTVPSPWVAETVRRDFRTEPIIIPHGVFWEEWQHSHDYIPDTVLWAKNRVFVDVCDPTPVNIIAKEMPDITFITTFAASGSPSNVVEIGLQDPNKIRLRIQKSALVLSTIKETWGLLYAEAQAAGTPVVTVDKGHVPTFVKHGVSGYCYKANSVEDMAKGIRYGLKYRDKLSSNAKKISRELTWDIAAERVARVVKLAHNRKLDKRPLVI